MAEPEAGAGEGVKAKPAEPRRSWLRRIIESGPAGRRQATDAVAWLLGTTLVAITALAGLTIWHLIRRGRMLRDRLEPPRIVRLPDPEELARNRDDDRPNHEHDPDHPRHSSSDRPSSDVPPA